MQKYAPFSEKVITLCNGLKVIRQYFLKPMSDDETQEMILDFFDENEMPLSLGIKMSRIDSSDYAFRISVYANQHLYKTSTRLIPEEWSTEKWHPSIKGTLTLDDLQPLKGLILSGFKFTKVRTQYGKVDGLVISLEHPSGEALDCHECEIYLDAYDYTKNGFEARQPDLEYHLI